MIHHSRAFWALNKRPTRPLIRDSPAQLLFCEAIYASDLVEPLLRFVECQVGGVLGRASRARITTPLTATVAYPF
jgi:hypothetical protein